MLRRRSLLTAAAAGALAPGFPAIVRAADAPGVTATSVKIGNTDAYSGNASAYAAVAKADAATFRMVNDAGGINGRTVDFISYDDAYSPPKTVEQTRRLIEQDQVACLFNPLGTASNTAIVKYCNAKKVPQLFVSTGADKWGDYKEHPWTIGWQPSYRTEAQIYAKYIKKSKPDAKIGILYQNDDFGKDYTSGMQDVLGPAYEKATVVSYEVTDPTIDSQAVSLQGAGVDTLLVAATPKFAAQAIRRLAEMGWKPTVFLTNVSASVGAVIKPAGAGERRRRHQFGVCQGPAGPTLEGRRRNARLARVHDEVPAGRRPERQQLRVRLRRDPDHGRCAQGVRERHVAGEPDEAGNEPHRPRDPGPAAGHQGQHQPDQLPPDPAPAADALDRLDVGSVRRRDRGRERVISGERSECRSPALLDPPLSRG